MADTLPPQTPPRKLFKPSSKTKTPTRTRASSQLSQQASSGSAQKTANDISRTVVSELPKPSNEPIADSVAKSTNLAPLTNVSATSDELAETMGSDTTGLVDNNILTPADSASRGTGAHSPLSRDTSQGAKRSPSFRDKAFRARDSAKESADESTGGLAGKFINGNSESAESDVFAGMDSIAEKFNSPADIAKYFKDQGFPEMSSFVTSLVGSGSGSGSQDSGENTPRPAKPSADGPKNHASQVTNGQKVERLGRAGSQQQSQSQENNQPDSANVSKTADGTFRDTEDNESIAKPTNKMGEPNVSNISQTARPAIRSTTSNTTKRPQGIPQTDGQDNDAHVIDNMGRPAHVERSIEIPLQRPGKQSNSPSPPEYEKQRRQSNDLGDFEDLPSMENLPNIDDLPAISEDDSQDPPEELLDPSVHATSPSITPIPKIPKIPHIDSSPPADLGRLAKGLAGHVVDDVGNVVDESGEVLGHATGDLPAMVGKKVSDDGEIYGESGEIVGYVSQNFVNPPSPTEIPGDLLGRLRVDHQGNILDSDGKIIGKFHEPLKSSSKAEPGAKSKEEQKPKVNAHTGGSPSDLFLDVKSTTDGIQLTIRIPTTFSRQPSESQSHS